MSATVNGAPTNIASSITYLPFGGITGLIYGNNLSLVQQHDLQYRVSSISVGSVFDLTYGYDENGNIISILDAINPPGGEPPEPPGVYSYEQGSNVLTAITGSSSSTFISDDAGNIISENNRTFGYDLLNRLITVTDNSTQIAAYTYNALNQSMKKVASAGTKIFHYDPQGKLIAETNQSGQILVEYIYLGDQPLAMIRPTEQVYYYHNDHLGTPRVLTGAGGSVVWKALYAPFGKVTITPATIENNIRFPGQYYDAETGLHYNWNRYYDPKMGRYITPDPLGLEGGINLFVYVDGNPVNWVDPEGLDVIVCFYPEAANGFGHVGFGPATSNNPTSGFYPTGNPLLSPGVVKPDTQTKKECKIMESTSKQDDCMQKCRDKRQEKRGWYSLLFRQCTYFLDTCLRECGLPSSPDNMLPKHLYDALPGKLK